MSTTSKIRPLLDGNGEITYPLTCSDALMNRDGNPVGEINDIFDISEYNASGDPLVFAKYDTLSLALADVPSTKRKGGMTVRYIQNSDNKYVQFRCKTQSFSTNPENWYFEGDETLVDNPEYIEAKTDSEGKTIEGIRAEGTKEINIPTIFKDDVTIEGNVKGAGFTAAMNSKVDKIPGKALSTNDYDDIEKASLDNNDNIVTQSFLGFNNLKQYIGHLAATTISSEYGNTAKYKVVRVHGGEKLFMGGGSSLRYFILKEFEYNPTLDYTVSLATGETGRRSGNASITLPSDASYIVIQTVNWQGNDCAPSSLIIDDWNIIDGKHEIKQNNDFLNTDNVAVEYLSGFGNLSEYVGHLDTEHISNYYGDVAKYKVLKVCGGDHVTISGSIVKLFILNSFDYNPILDYSVSFATGETGRRNTAIDMDLPSDAKYICIQTVNYQGIDCQISEIVINDYDIVNRTFLPDEVIRPYFRNELETTINSVRALITEPCLIFPLVTDIHYKHIYSNSDIMRYQTFDSMIQNMKYVADRIPCDFLMNLGDSMTIPSTSDTDYMNEKFQSVGIPYYMAIGNHDVYHLYNKGVIYRANLMNVKYKDNYNVNNNGDYYIDYDSLGIRVIVLNTNNVSTMRSYSSYTADWLESTLVNDKVNVLCEHLSCIKEHNYDLDNIQGSDDIKEILQTFVNGGGTLIELCGHTHADYAFTTPSAPWLNIFSGCQTFEAASPSYPAFVKITGYTGDFLIPARQEGTYTEDLWTVVVIRPLLRKINLVRFGAGNDREFDF